MLDVDHDQVTKRVRGLLCNFHNRMLGYAHYDKKLLRAAADYLDRVGRAVGL